MSIVLGDVLPLAAAYGLMVCAQCFGGDIIGRLHGEAAAAAAMVLPDDVGPELSLAQMCEGYGNHHFDAVSNGFHAAGMLAAIISLLVALWPSHVTTGQRLLSGLWVPPQWYIGAWVGHFFLQKDIPAVFAYGVQLRTWAAGELCSAKWVFSGDAFAEKPSLLTGGAPVPFRHGAALALAQLVVLAAMTPAGSIWQHALSGGKAAAKGTLREVLDNAAIVAAAVAAAIVLVIRSYE